MKSQTYEGFVKAGKLHIELPFNNKLAEYNNAAVTITISKQKSNRSLRQNSYLWGVVYKILSEETGHTPEDLHEIFKLKYLTAQRQLKIGDFVQNWNIGRSTTTLSTSEFKEFIEKICLLAAEMGIVIPEPGEMG